MLKSAIIPVISKAVDSIITNKTEKDELQLKLKELELQENIESKKVVGQMLSNHNLFVSGGIPAIIWLVVAYVCFNYIIFPLLKGCGLPVATIALPEQYWTLLNIVIVGIFGKKTIDGNEWHFGGKMLCPSKAQIDEAVRQGDTTPIGNRKAIKDMSDEEFNDLYNSYVAKYKKKPSKE